MRLETQLIHAGACGPGLHITKCVRKCPRLSVTRQCLPREGWPSGAHVPAHACMRAVCHVPGEPREHPGGAVVMPVYQSATFLHTYMRPAGARLPVAAAAPHYIGVLRLTIALRADTPNHTVTPRPAAAQRPARPGPQARRARTRAPAARTRARAGAGRQARRAGGHRGRRRGQLRHGRRLSHAALAPRPGRPPTDAGGAAHPPARTPGLPAPSCRCARAAGVAAALRRRRRRPPATARRPQPA